MNKLKEADEALERGWLTTAQIIYSQSGKRIPKEKLIKCGGVCVEQWFYTNFLREGYSDDWLESALRSYRLAKYEDGIAKVADCFISKDKWNRAFDIFMGLKDKKKIREYSYFFYQNGMDKLVVYGYPGVTMPETDFYEKHFVAGKDREGRTIWKSISADSILGAVDSELEEMIDSIKGKIISDFLGVFI